MNLKAKNLQTVATITLTLLFSQVSQASLVTTKLEAQFQIGHAISLSGLPVTNENIEATGIAIGLGTSEVTYGVGFCDPTFPDPEGCGTDPEPLTIIIENGKQNSLSFETAGLQEGNVPTGSFLLGELTFENIDFFWKDFYITSFLLEISAIECDMFGDNCDESTRHTGTTELDFRYTVNDPLDYLGSSDSICLETELGTVDPLCAWVPEYESASFEVYGRFGSLIIEDVIPSTSNGFVTAGYDIDNVKYAVTSVTEPSSLILFALSFAGLLTVSRKNS